jgi:hypothetical protein
MATQDLQGLVQQLRDEASHDEFPIGFAHRLLDEAADALERLSKARGTCSSCRFYQCGYPTGHCDNDRSAASSIVDAMASDWGCRLHEPQPTATEEASKPSQEEFWTIPGHQAKDCPVCRSVGAEEGK